MKSSRLSASHMCRASQPSVCKTAGRGACHTIVDPPGGRRHPNSTWSVVKPPDFDTQIRLWAIIERRSENPTLVKSLVKCKIRHPRLHGLPPAARTSQQTHWRPTAWMAGAQLAGVWMRAVIRGQYAAPKSVKGRSDGQAGRSFGNITRPFL